MRSYRAWARRFGLPALAPESQMRKAVNGTEVLAVAGCNCPFCHCSTPEGNGARGFKMATGPAFKKIPPRSAATHAADLASLAAKLVTSPKSKKKNWNGVSADTCIPVDWARLIPPYLHLMLGLVNDEVKKIYKELLGLDGVDEESARLLETLTGDAARLEDDFIDQIEVVIDLLSSTNVFVLSTFGSTPDLGRSVEEMPIATWDSLAEEANLKAAAKSAAGAALAALTLNAANQKLSRRQLHINEESALQMENEASKLRAGATALITAKDAVVAARAAVEAEEFTQAAKAATDGNEAATGGVLIAAMKSTLQEHHISVQRYWNATLVGPDVRRFLAAYEAILETLAAKITASNGQQIAAEFNARHSAVLKQLAVASHLTRKTEKLSALELDQLEFACTAFGDAFR